MAIDATQLDRLIDGLDEVMDLAVPVAIDIERREILQRTKSGVDADGIKFHDYGPAQKKKREKANLGTSIKDISFSGETLASMGRYNDDELTVSNARMPIMVGQMQHPKWPYHHNVLGVNDKDIPLIERGITQMIEEVLG